MVWVLHRFDADKPKISISALSTPTMIPTPSSNYNLQCTDPPNSFQGTSNLFNYKQTRDSYNNRELSPKS